MMATEMRGTLQLVHAIAIRNAIPAVLLDLELSEPALMEFVIALSNQETVEVHSVANTRGAEGRR